MRRFMVALTAVAVGLMTACASGQGATPRPRPASTYAMASPAPYAKIDLQFVGRVYVYVDEALMLARLAATRSANPHIAQLAAELSTVQQGNVQQLSGWLRQWGKKPPGMPLSPADGSWPGLATASQIARVARLSRVTFDHKFLKLLIADQRGELAVGTTEQEGGKFGPARQLASQIVSGSTLAIVRMMHLLRQP